MGKEWDNNNFCTCSPDKVLGVYLGNLCLEHDLNYIHQNISRKEADKLLRERIIHEFKLYGFKYTGYLIANIYYLFVRMFGSFYWK